MLEYKLYCFLGVSAFTYGTFYVRRTEADKGGCAGTTFQSGSRGREGHH